MILFVIIGLIVAGLPMFLNTDYGKKQLETWVNQKIPGSLEIRLLDLHWGKGQRIEGVVMRDSDGQSVLEFEKLYTDASLWKLLMQSTQLGFTRIKDLNAALVIDQNGQSNLQKALGIESDYISTIPTTISISDVQGDFYLTQDSSIPFSAHLKGTTREASSSGSFDIDIVLNELNSVDWVELKDEISELLSVEGGVEAKIQAKVINFPVDIIDQFLILKGSKARLKPIFGDKIDIVLDKQPDTKDLVFNLDVTTPFAHGHFKATVVEDQFVLREPGNFSLVLAQPALEYLSDSVISLNESITLNVVLEKFEIPLHFFSSAAQVLDYSFLIKVTTDASQIKINNFSLIDIQQFTATVASSAEQKFIDVNLLGKASYESNPFSLDMHSILNKPANIQNLREDLAKNVQISTKISQFPLEIFNSFKNISSLITHFGKTVNLALDIDSDQNQVLNGNLSISTKTSEIKQMHFQIDEEFRLTEPFKINWSIPPQAFIDIFHLETLVIKQPIPAIITITDLNFPLKNFKKMTLKLNSSIERIIFSDQNLKTNFVIKNLLLNLISTNISEWKTDLSLQAFALNKDNSTPLFFDTPLNLTAEANIKANFKKSFEIPSLQMSIHNSQVDVKLNGQLTPDSIFIHNKPFQIKYLLTPKAFKELCQIFDLPKMPQLTNSSLIQLNLVPTPLDFKNNWLSKLTLKGEASVKELTFKDNANLSFSLKDLQLPLFLDTRHNLLNVSLNGLGYTNLETKPNSFYINLKIEDWFQNNKFDLSLSKTELSSHFIALPTSFVSGLMAYPDLTPILGNSIDIELKTLFDREKQDSGYWDMNIDSKTFHAKARLFLGETITLYQSKNPTAIARWTITPEGYEFLKKNYFPTSLSTLLEPFTINAHLSSLNFPLSFNVVTLEEGQFKAHISTSDLKLEHPKLSSSSKIEAEISSQSLSHSVDINASMKAENFDLVIKSIIKDLYKDTGQLRKLQDMHVNLNLEAHQFPLAYFKAFNIREDDQIDNLTLLFGETVNVKNHLDLHRLTGPLELSIEGQNGKEELKGELKSGILKLTTPFKYTLNINSAFTERMSKKSSSFLNTVIEADQPVSLEIDPQGFSCPILPFDFNQLVITKGTLKTSKIRFSNQGTLKNLLNYIAPISENSFTIWSTPIYFGINESLLNVQRFDMLVANRYPLACWGNMNLVTEKINVILGLTASTLNQTFGINGLDKDFILQVPVRSYNGKMEIDKSKVVTKISTLIAKMTNKNKENWMGNLLSLIVEDPTENPTPKPTTTPLPWENSTESKAEKPTENAKNISNTPNALNTPKTKKPKRIKDKVNSFLKKLEEL